MRPGTSAPTPRPRRRNTRGVRRLLDQGWTVRAVAGPVPAALDGAVVPATVPGSVHTDLLAAGLIPDPYLDENEALLAWVGDVDWRYETTLRPGAPRTRPRGTRSSSSSLEGLDTVATVELDGGVVGADREHAPHVPRSTSPACGGGARPRRHLRRARARRAPAERGARPAAAHQRAPLQRDPQDGLQLRLGLGPDLATSGIWRPLALRRLEHRPARRRTAARRRRARHRLDRAPARARRRRACARARTVR